MGRALEESKQSPDPQKEKLLPPERENEPQSPEPPEEEAATEAQLRARGASPAPAAQKGPVMSAHRRAYFQDLMGDVEHAYEIARAARGKGKDPVLEVEILPAEDLAARVEAQVHVAGVAEDIRKVTKELTNRELVALKIAGRVAAGHYGEFKSREEAVDKAVRTGLSILTEGVLVAPLEGIAEVKIGTNSDGSEYVDLYFAGPIRAAGGTAQALSVLIADVVRREAGIGEYQVTPAEVERYKEEVPAYRQAANLQYTPDADEIDLIVSNCPVCLNGEGTDRVEVTGNRDLPRVPTNQLRGGAMLVLCEGMCLKAPKIQKHVKKLGLEGWGFLDRLLEKHEEEKPDEQDAQDDDGIPEIEPASKYVRDLIAGRPVFSHPSRPGGFRLRYGRARTAGLAAVALHPALMHLMDDFVAIGTQLKTERPGKGTIATPCDSLQPPVVLLKTGDVLSVSDAREVQAVKPFVKEVLDLGEILVPFGEFAENNHLLVHSPWVSEWFALVLQERALEGWPEGLPEIDEILAMDKAGTLEGPLAHAVAKRAQVPLAPNHTLPWHDLECTEIIDFSDHLADAGAAVTFKQPGTREATEVIPEPPMDEQVLVLPNDEVTKGYLERLLLPHRSLPGHLEVTRDGYALVRGLAFEREGDTIVATDRRKLLAEGVPQDLARRYPSVDLASRLAGVSLMPKHPVRIGARMGRPEKASQRKMKPPPHSLFPLGLAGGMQRLFADSILKGKLRVEAGKRACSACGELTYRTFCSCGSHTEESGEPEEVEIDVRGELRRAVEALGVSRAPPKMKGVVGLMSKHKTPEPIEKGILRAKYGITTFKDGTARFDMTDAPLTHFRPKEIKTSVERLRELGYETDQDGAPLERDDQVVELQVQDVVVPETCGDFLVSCSRFVDDLLERFYRMEPFYKAETRDDMVGHLVGGLAPHTSGAIVARVIGYTPSQMGWAHPYFHAGKRRNADGDEDAIFLLMDGLLNFSKHYVPDRRGGLMDLPLVLTTRLDPSEIDKEAHNLDVLRAYPLAFYEATRIHAHPREVEERMGMVGKRLGTEGQYEGLGFTHDTPDISQGVLVSAYKTIPDMMAKLEAQFELANKIRAVDLKDVASRVIGGHFMPDLIGNLKAFSKQKVRCPACNTKYRRMPIAGRCLTPDCKGRLTLTVHQGSVRKYLQPALEISRKYEVAPYTLQRIMLAEKSIDSLFNNDKVRKAKLSDFLGEE